MHDTFVLYINEKHKWALWDVYLNQAIRILVENLIMLTQKQLHFLLLICPSHEPSNKYADHL